MMKGTQVAWLASAALAGMGSGFLLAAVLIFNTATAQVPPECPVCTCPPPPPCPVPGEPSEAVKKALEAIKAAEQSAEQQIGPKP